jgi:hypothetical protein
MVGGTFNVVILNDTSTIAANYITEPDVLVRFTGIRATSCDSDHDYMLNALKASACIRRYGRCICLSHITLGREKDLPRLCRLGAISDCAHIIYIWISAHS